MTSGLGRLYATVLALVVFFLAWSVIAARPWVSEQAARTDPRLVSLQAREQRLRRDAIAVNRIVQKRWALYRVQLAQRTHQIAEIKAKQAAQAQAARQIQVSQRSQPSYQAAAPSAPVVRVAPSKPATSTRSS